MFGRTDVNETADKIPDPVGVRVVGDAYNITWQAPSRPNGIILRYDIGIRLVCFSFLFYLNCLQLVLIFASLSIRFIRHVSLLQHKLFIGDNFAL